jgi:hypothetical protein
VRTAAKTYVNVAMAIQHRYGVKNARIKKMKLKQGYCEYEDCGLDLGMVHIATKFCSVHREKKRKQDAQTYHRERYKSKFHRDHVIKEAIKNPEPLPKGLREGGPCPGNGNGVCGAMIRLERVMDTKGYTTPFFDYTCGIHRFPDPGEEKSND